MTFPTQIFYYLIAAIVSVFALMLASANQRRERLGNLLLVLLTVFIVSFLYHAFTSNKLGRTNGGVAADQAEINLRIVAMAKAVQERTLSGKAEGAMNTLPKQALAEPVDTAAEKDALSKAITALDEAIRQNPQSRGYKGRLVVVLGAQEKLLTAGQTNRQRLSALCTELQSNPGGDAKAQTWQKAGAVLERIYVAHKEDKSAVDADNAALESAFTPGWYRDQATLSLLSVSGDQQRFQSLRASIEDKYINTFLKLLSVLLVVIGSGLLGLIVAFAQLAFIARQGEQKPDEVGLDLPLKTVYAVFAGWFAVELMVSFGYHFVEGRLPSLSAQPLSVAATTTFTYVLSNIAAPLLIYYVAMRPNNLNFWQTLRFTGRTSTADRGKLILFGFLGWCAAIPLVAGTALIAQRLLHSNGSDNPVLGQILQAAGGSSVPATLLFYITLGVLAPLFEETLFRGFIFAALKPRIGSFAAILASASLFALMHFDKGGSLMLFAIGVVLAYLFDRTRSLVPSMICHGLWNSGTFTLALLIMG